jgi:hypothetical protein
LSERDTIVLTRKVCAAALPIAGKKAEAYLRARKNSANLHGASLRDQPSSVPSGEGIESVLSLKSIAPVRFSSRQISIIAYKPASRPR